MINIPYQAAQFGYANGIELCYDIFGAEDAHPMIMIMGLGAQMIEWDEEFCKELAASGIRVIRFDNRDVGQSTWMSSPYTLADMANDVVGLMDLLNLKSAHVVGASIGSAIAQELAIVAPQRVRSLTLTMSSTGDPALPMSGEAMALVSLPPPTTREGFISHYTQMSKRLRAGTFPEDEQRDRDRAEHVFARGFNPTAASRQLQAELASGNRKPRLVRVVAPTLVIHGAIDPLMSPDHGRDTAASIPGANLLIISGMGHAIPRPRPMWQQIVSAIAGHVHSYERKIAQRAAATVRQRDVDSER